jgi:serine/threonine protein kinase
MWPLSDIGPSNLMMDESTVVPRGSHFCQPWTHDGKESLTWRNRCTVPLVQYYYIDFGLSTWHQIGHNAVVLGRYGQVKTVPELSDTSPYNPFKADVYQLGCTLLEVIQVSTY